MRPVVFITGASAGIGAAAVGVFASAGYDVVLAARRKDKLDLVASTVAAKVPAARLLPVVCDVNFDASVTAAVEQVRAQFGRLDVLVNNAGYGVYGSVESTPLEKFRQNMETNYFGVIRCTQAALPLLRTAAQSPENRSRRWRASIVMVSSFVGRRAIPYLSSYCATKFALEGFSEALRVELHDERIAVSVVNPGVTETDFVQSAHGVRPRAFLSSGGMTSAAVAQVILKCAKRRRRNVYLTTAGKMGLAMQWLAPSIFDHLMLKTWRKSVNEPE